MRFQVKRLVLILSLFFIAIAVGVYIYQIQIFTSPISIDTTGQPTIGNPKAKVHLVVIEEPKCSGCKKFNQIVFPQIQEHYIQKEEVLYTVIPVSFLKGSLPAANALLCVYYQDPTRPNSDLFFTYIDYLYDHQPAKHTDWVTDDRLINMADQASHAIDLSKLRACLVKQAYRDQIAKNTEYVRSMMGGKIQTPAVYINGILAKDHSYKTISKLIEKVKKHVDAP